MIAPHRVIVTALAWASLSAVASAQAPPTPVRRQPQTPGVGQPPRTNRGPQTRSAYRPTQYHQGDPSSYGGYPYDPNHPGHGSVLRNYGTDPNATWGFRNPGGVGKFGEYYPPGNRFQNGGRDPVAKAGFDQNIPVGSIQEQAMATQVGTQRYSVMQQHMDNFARPMGFYGFYGFGGGVPF